MIRLATSSRDIALARALFLEYAQWLNVDLCFQGFEQEVATLPGAYAAPHGRLFLAGEADDAFGCIALRPLMREAGCGATCTGGDIASAPNVGEVKRLYVQPARRSGGWGRELVERIIEEACAIGYRELRLDTLPQMTAAHKLYADHGFRECAPYYANPLPGVVYMSCTL